MSVARSVDGNLLKESPPFINILTHFSDSKHEEKVLFVEITEKWVTPLRIGNTRQDVCFPSLDSSSFVSRRHGKVQEVRVLTANPPFWKRAPSVRRGFKGYSSTVLVQSF